ncbi:MAG: rhomboid family intramembrane serine protease [Bacteroidia bacterium]|nr:rhomboid family intramembrane serine protease [Bacteroidia bacterium]
METEHKNLLRQAVVPSVMLAAMWLVWGAEWLSGSDFSTLGIFPRKFSGLWGILISPFIHGDLGHISSNSIPILVLGIALFSFYHKIAGQVLFILWIGTGIGVWIIARPSYHIGASGVVYSLVFFIFFSGVFRRETRAIALALIVALLYGSSLWGIFPIQEGVSWESHLLGACTGIVTAFYFRKKGPEKKKYDWENEPDEDSDQDETEPWNYKSLFPPPEGFGYPEK